MFNLYLSPVSINKETFRTATICLLICAFIFSNATAQQFEYNDSWGSQGFTLTSQKSNSAEVVYSIQSFSVEKAMVNGEMLDKIELPGVWLPNDEGMPNLPGQGRFIAIPQGAKPVLEVTASRIETIKDIDLAPAPRIPWESENGPLEYSQNKEVYGKNAFYPLEPVIISEVTQIRGVDVVTLGVTPYQYNPVTKELIIYRDLKINVEFQGGTSHFGEDRLRSRWWDVLLSDMLLNYASLPKIEYQNTSQNPKTIGCDYLIITPTNPEFLQWADSIRVFRNIQGIKTDVMTVAQAGGNNATTLKNFFNNAYSTWDIVPTAVLLLGDHGTNAANSVISPIYNNYCVSDNIYADMSGNHMPDIVFARMTAQNATHLQTMVTKFLDYERNPPINPAYYDNPITACGWQTERWFQICAESVGGYWKHVQGKNTVRINDIYSGSPGSSWSTAQNTATVVNYFGPNGLGYIPSSPSVLGGWSGGNATMINNTINNGSFMMLHRDHGYEQGWGEPVYNNNHINGLVNTDLTFVWSINCLTGKYNISGECFAEKFHRHTHSGQNAGALGIIAASEISYSFVNDTYVWGAMDNMWPDFMPDYGSTPAERGVLPAFANSAGKYFLQQSNWPYNTNNKTVTYNLFHHHGDAFMTVYSEIPQALTVTHNPVILAGVTNFDITANEGAYIGLTVNGEIIGTAEATGMPLSIAIPGQVPPDQVVVTVTKQNYYRYTSVVNVIPPSGPYVVQESFSINDISGGNGNGVLDYGESVMLSLAVQNVGVQPANNVVVTLSTVDSYITITNAVATYGTIPAGGTIELVDAFSFQTANDIPDGHIVAFEISATDGNETWTSYLSIPAHAPILEFVDFLVLDDDGNNNGLLDPGETAEIVVTIMNSGSSLAHNIYGDLVVNDPFVTINASSVNFGNIDGGNTALGSFTVTASPATPLGHFTSLSLDLSADLGITGSANFSLVIGRIPILIIDLDGNQNSAVHMENALQDTEIVFEKMNSFPPDLDLYSSIFVCLGVFNNNHVLTSTQGQLLASYLNNGGNLYIEGGDTWFYDPTTAVHPMFKINAIADGSGDMSTVIGQTGTFTEGMSFPYNGDNNWMDRIEPISPAVKILQNQSPSYGTGVAYDEGSYRTIGTSHEFGGLTDGTYPSTKDELMQQYLDFFGISVSLQAFYVSSVTEICEAESVEFFDQSIGGPVSWTWTFEGGSPETSALPNPVVAYFNSGTFDVMLEVSDGSETSVITMDNYITVMAMPGQASQPEGDEEVCTNSMEYSIYTIPETAFATSYSWEISPAEAGVISGDGLTATVIWTPDWEGIAGIRVKAINDCGEGIESDEISVYCSICTGTDDLLDLLETRIFPNPSDGRIYIEFSDNIGNTEIVVLNIFGEQVHTEKIFAEKGSVLEINLGKISKGVYFIRLKASESEETRKIVIR